MAAYNRTTSKVDHFLENEAKGTKVVGAHSIQEFVSLLKRPRKIILLVKAGPAVDSFIQQLEPYLEKGDIVIDGGNSHFPDSERRTKELESKGLLFVGSGVSGGEEGARHGPSLMPGGSAAAWPEIKEIFQKTAAQSDGEPCCDWVGDGGAGHFVECIRKTRELSPGTQIEVLVPDFRGRMDRALDILKAAPPDVMNHNLETVPRLYKEARPGSDYQFSLNLLKRFKDFAPHVPTKSGLMVGLGETDEEILQVMRDMRAHNIDMLTIGQYLAPSNSHLPVRRYVHPDTFKMFEEEARKMCFTHAAVGAMVRSSYHADQQAIQAGVQV